MKQAAAGPQAPVVARTTGVNDPRSMFTIRSSYSRLLQRSWRLNRLAGEQSTYDGAFGWKTRTSKKASSPRVQKPLARTSARASGAVLADRQENTSPLNDWRQGSTRTSWHTSVRSSPKRSRNSLCRTVGNPPWEQTIAWLVEKGVPHTHFSGVPGIYIYIWSTIVSFWGITPPFSV